MQDGARRARRRPAGVSSEDLRPCRLANGDDGRVLDLALYRDGIESLPDLLAASYDLDLVASANLLFHHIGRGEDAKPSLAQDVCQRRIVELSDDSWAD